MSFVPVLLAVSLFGAPSSAHPSSLSSSRIDVEGARVRHDLLLQSVSLVEALPGIDANGDGVLEAGELAEHRDSIGEYVTGRHRLFADLEYARELERSVESIQLAPPPFPAPQGEPPWVRVDSTFEDAAPLEVLGVEMRLFVLTIPGHRDLCSLRWDRVPAFETTFTRFEPRRVFRRADVQLSARRSRNQTPDAGHLSSAAQRSAISFQRSAPGLEPAEEPSQRALDAHGIFEEGGPGFEATRQFLNAGQHLWAQRLKAPT